ncbi:Phosphatidylinositol 3,4,5-trisphosphate-dependent Rac exchanger 1 protein [Sciurus carolinensis]|uniref:Phosphatidylinositol 3,4,5-trisphosphate-dependent Rac exchanger 1 protein n=1 Tax=Sciurus carolinensis TaxID=30640 RepID=A0AA41STT5_SCICA|nr:Phosphatidylinositol 3,4,5-trisphosphate-dependent Rac exchanger 1 protein [Sciurus carolinensis]
MTMPSLVHADYHSNGYIVTNDWKIHNTTKNKLFVCMAKMVEEKHKWLDTIICKWEQCDRVRVGCLTRSALGPQILPQEEDYGFDIEENKTMMVKSVQRGLLAEGQCILKVTGSSMASKGALGDPGALSGISELRPISTEFKQKEECMVRDWSLIQISIQEDPWHLPSSIKTLVDNIQRDVEDRKNQLLLALRKCTDTNVFYHIEGRRQALKVVFYLDSYHFYKLPSCLERRASLRMHVMLFMKALENVEGPPPPGRQEAEDFQQEINAQSLENVQQYYHKLRYVLGPMSGQDSESRHSRWQAYIPSA